MLKKNKKITLLLSGLSGALLVSSAAGVALASCSTTSSSSSSTDVQYSYVIDWNNKDAVDRLIIDDNGLVYSDNAMTTIIAVSPKVKLATVKIPSRVKSIAGYSRVMYKSNTDSNVIVDQIPANQNASNYTKVYKSYGAFQGMESLETVALEAGSQLQSIGGSAFYGCTTLKNISGLSNSLKYIGALAFTNCSNLQAIDLSNVVNIGAGAFTSCTSLTSVNLSNAFYIGDYAFQYCSGLTEIGSLKQVRTLGLNVFQSAFVSGSNITLELNNLLYVRASTFQDAQGITKVDFSGNTLLTGIDYSAFMGSSITEVDFTGCTNLSAINERAFKNCANLTTVYLPANDISSLTEIGSNAFANCSNLATVAPKNSTGFVSTSKMSTLGANFLANTAITSLDLSNFTIKNSVSSIAPFGSQMSLAFITNLKSVTFPSTLTRLSAGLFYGSGIAENAGFSLTLSSAINSIEFNSSIPIVSPIDNTSSTLSNVSPFTNSGLTSIDMSKITSYQLNNTNSIPAYLFNGTTKLKSVVLKPSTNRIETYAFANTSALNSITYPASSETTPSTIADNTSNGFTASSSITTINANAFNGAFSPTSNATLDLSQMTFTSNTTPDAFNNSNFASIILPTTTKIIAANSFNNMTKLASVNFEQLTSLTQISAPNFNKTQLASIDLSKVINAASLFPNAGTTDTTKLFTDLPVGCVVSLPSTIGNFSYVFKDTTNNYVTFNYPNGINDSLITATGGVLGFATSNKNLSLTQNINTLDLSSKTNITSIGTNTFFGNSKLTSLTLPANGISNKNIFTGSTSMSASANNTTSNSSYVKANVPFGNNTAFTSLNYVGFSKKTSASETIATDTTAQTSLFSTTNATTWTEIAKIINSLSYQAAPTSVENAKTLKSNMTTWTAADGVASPMNTDEAPVFTDNTSVVLKKSYESSSASAIADITISASAATASFIHNGVVWTYTNDGSSIKLVGKVNMYKAMNSSSTNNSFLVFFNQTTYPTTASSDSTAYYVPGTTPVTVTLTIATKASSN